MVSGPPGIVWYRNLGAGSFAFQETLMPDFPGVEFEPGDFNGDGMADIVFAHESFNNLCWTKNTGNGKFNPFIILNNDSIDPRYLLVCDLDLDGDEDIIVSFSPHDRSCWYENDGNANFILQQLDAPVHEGIVRGVWDKEGDGDPDLIIQDENHIQWLENNGEGIFNDPQIINEEVILASGVFASDIDADGDLDVISSFEIIRITITDMSGRMITSVENPGGQAQIRLSLPPDTNGVCILRALFANGSSTAEKVALY